MLRDYQVSKKPINTHPAEEIIQQIILQLQPKIKVIQQYQQVFSDQKDPVIKQIIDQSKKELKDQIVVLSRKFGIDTIDIISKIQTEIAKQNILDARQKREKDIAENKTREVVDLIDENQLLLRRGVPVSELSNKEHPLYKFYDRYMRSEKGEPYLKEADVLTDKEREYIGQKLPEDYKLKFVRPIAGGGSQFKMAGDYYKENILRDLLRRKIFGRPLEKQAFQNLKDDDERTKVATLVRRAEENMIKRLKEENKEESKFEDEKQRFFQIHEEEFGQIKKKMKGQVELGKFQKEDQKKEEVLQEVLKTIENKNTQYIAKLKKIFTLPDGKQQTIQLYDILKEKDIVLPTLKEDRRDILSKVIEQDWPSYDIKTKQKIMAMIEKLKFDSNYKESTIERLKSLQ